MRSGKDPCCSVCPPLGHNKLQEPVLIKLFVKHCDSCTSILYENQIMLTLKCYTFRYLFRVAIAIKQHKLP